MTLITHLWTKKINVIAGDGRISDKTLINPIVTDEMRKIYPNKDNFIAFHGNVRINSKENVPTLLKNIQNDTKISSSNDITTKIIEGLKNQEKDFSTGFIYGGQFPNVEAFCYKNGKVEKIAHEIGVNLNFDTLEQQQKLIFHLNQAIKTVTNDSLYDWRLDFYSNEDFIKIFEIFYQNSFIDKISNPDGGIGNKLDLGIIRDGKFEWLKTETKIFDVTNS